MGFVVEDDVIDVMEAVMAAVFTATGFACAAPPWPRMPYDEAVARFGVDRPDTRFGLEIRDVGALLDGSDFKVFQGVLDGGGVVRALNAGAHELSRSELDGLNDVVRVHGAKAVAPIYAEAGDGGATGWAGNLAKFFTAEQIAAVNAELGASPGDLLLFVADQPRVAAAALGGLRLHLGERFGLIPQDRHDLLWITDFPMFEQADDGSWTALHHPFTAPEGDLADPGALRSRAYDLVLDGVEIGGGSIRIHTPEVQQAVFDHIGLPADEARERFGFLLEALRYGAPPHGGIAMGIDRIVALIMGRESIRDVMAFPKTATGADPLTGAPAAVEERQLRELTLKSLAPPPTAG
jgi:aspartyl-tRNA synthetase